MKPTIVPFVKWVGGKRQLIKQLIERMPLEYKTYYEPFVGGGALLFALQPEKAIINDLNKELMNTYKVIRTRYSRLREYLILMEYGHQEEFFTKLRNIDKNPIDDMRLISMEKGSHLNRASSELRAARFIYLNKAGFNGLYRVNSKGHFNVPSGKKTKVKTHEYPNIKEISRYLKSSVEIKNMDYVKATNDAMKGDFVYFDPPYDYEVEHKGFDSYQKGGFGRKDQLSLANWCKELNKRGVKWMVSNHNTKYIQELYKDFNVEIIKAKRLVGGKGASREDVEEVIVRNYD